MSSNCHNGALTNGDADAGLSLAVSAPGKVILHGEYSVVYGKLAVAGSLGLRTKIRLVEVQQCRIGLELKALNLSRVYDFDAITSDLWQQPLPLQQCASNFSLEHPELVDHEALLKQIEDFAKRHAGTTLDYTQQLAFTSLFYLFRAILASTDIPVEPFDLHIDTDLTISAGTGSSASYLVCVTAVFYQYIRLKLGFRENVSRNGYKPCKLHVSDLRGFDRKELELISKWAYCAERIIHGAPSGVDNTTCTFGSLVEFSKSTGAKRLEVPGKFRVLLVNTRVARDTKEMVRRFLSLKERHGAVVEPILEAMDNLVRDVLECFEQLHLDTCKERKLYERLGELTDMNQSLLAALNTSHPALDKICAILKEGGLHGKLTGAGGGGYAIALVPPYLEEGSLRGLMDRLVGEGFGALVADLGGPGVTVDL